MRLGIAIQYFASGSLYDIVVKFGVSHTSVFESVWMIVEAMNELQVIKLNFYLMLLNRKRFQGDF